MDADLVIEVGKRSLEVIVLLSAPILLAALAVGLLVSMLQAATQINEMTLTFVPKLGVIVVVLFLAGPWMLGVLTDFTTELIESIPEMLR